MICPKCGSKMEDGSAFCTVCGTSLIGGVQGNAALQPNYDLKDHTAEFDVKDISDNKVMALLPYLMGIVGVVIALLACRESAYTYFHVRQALKIEVVTILLGIIMLIFCWTVIIPLAGAVCIIILFCVRIICFFQVCAGKAKEPVIVNSLGFLK